MYCITAWFYNWGKIYILEILCTYKLFYADLVQIFHLYLCLVPVWLLVDPDFMSEILSGSLSACWLHVSMSDSQSPCLSFCLTDSMSPCLSPRLTLCLACSCWAGSACRLHSWWYLETDSDWSLVPIQTSAYCTLGTVSQKHDQVR